MARYIAVIDLFIYADSDEDALRQAQEFADRENAKNDNNCKVIELFENRFGSLESRKVYPADSDADDKKEKP